MKPSFLTLFVIFSFHALFPQAKNNSRDIRPILFSHLSPVNIKIASYDEFYSPKKKTSKILLNQFSEYKKSFFGIGVHLGFGTGINSGPFANHYSPLYSMSGGADLFFEKSVLSFDVTSEKHDLKSVYSGSKVFEESSGTDIINITAGYSIIEKEKFRFTPFIGGAHIEFTTNNSLNEQLKEVDNNYILGLNICYKFRNKLKLKESSFLKMNRYTVSMIQLKSMMTKIHFYDDFEGYLFNFSLVIAWQVNKANPNNK